MFSGHGDLQKCKQKTTYKDFQELISFAMMHEGSRHLNVVDSIMATAITCGSDGSQGLSSKDREDLSYLYLKALISSDKPKLKVGQSQLQSPHLVSHPNTPRPLSVKSDVPKTSTVGKLLVLKPSRERNGISPTAKESLSPTAGMVNYFFYVPWVGMKLLRRRKAALLKRRSV